MVATRRPRRCWFAAIPITLIIAGCGSDSGTGPDPNPDPGQTGTPAIALALSATSANVQQGGSTSFTATVTRSGGFTGAVTTVVEGAPAGVTTASSNVQTSGSVTTATVTVQVGATAAAGTSALTVRATGSGVTAATATFNLTVTAGGTGGTTGNATFDFAACPAQSRPIWFAYQDGAGPWTRVAGAADVYSFEISEARAGVAWTMPNGAGNTVSVQYMTRAELSSTPIVACGSFAATKTVTGSIAGTLSQYDFVQIWLGNGAGNATSQASTFQIVNVRDGSHDLIAWRHDLLGGGNPDRGFIRRDQNIANNGSVGTLDLNGAESFTPATAAITVTGLAAGETLTHGMNYYTGSCDFAALYQGPAVTTGTVTASGFPASLQRASDLHQISITAISGTSNRVAQEQFHALVDRTIALPAAIPAPAISTLTAPYARLQAVFDVPAEYNGAAIFQYADQSSQHAAAISGTSAWIGGSTATLAMPDLSAVAGWDNAWPPAAGASGSWVVQATGSNLTGPLFCQDGTRISSAQRLGIY